MSGRTCLLAGSIVVGLMVSGGAGAEPLKLGHSTWVGYGPLYIAQEQGYFDEEGVEVELIVMEDPKLRFAALAAGQIDVAVTTVDTMLNYLNENQGYRYLFALDDSKGGDGIVANKDIASVADLKGKSVAYARGLGLAVLSRRAAQAGGAEDLRRPDPEHDRGRRRRRVRRRAGRRRGHLGALADPRQAGASTATCWSTARPARA